MNCGPTSVGLRRLGNHDHGNRLGLPDGGELSMTDGREPGEHGQTANAPPIDVAER